jgi:hypothetical protein
MRAPDGAAYQAYAGTALRVSRSCFAKDEFGAEAIEARERAVAAMRGMSSLLNRG